MRGRRVATDRTGEGVQAGRRWEEGTLAVDRRRRGREGRLGKRWMRTRWRRSAHGMNVCLGELAPGGSPRI